MIPIAISVFAALSGLAAPASGAESNDPVKALHDFVEKLKSKTPTGPESARPGRDVAVLSKFRSLEAAFTRGDYEKAHQALGGIPLADVPTDSQEEWLALSAKLSSQLEQIALQARERMRMEVDQLINDVHQACLAARKSADLDPLLMRCAALQMQRPGDSDIVARRIQQKLAGVAATLQAWTKYLDFQVTQKPQAGNHALQDLLNNSAEFPVISSEEIRTRLTAGDDREPDPVERAVSILKSIKKPEDIGSGVALLNQLMAEGPPAQGIVIRQVRDNLEALNTAWGQAKQGDAALRTLRSQPGRSFESPWQRPLQAIEEFVVQAIVDNKLRQLAPGETKIGESPRAQIDAGLSALAAKDNYAAMIELMKVAQALPEWAGFHDNEFFEQIYALERFLAAQRFEKAGDPLGAINDYRSVVSATGKYVPSQRATEALAKIKAANPDAFKDYEGSVLRELHDLREELRAMRRMPPGWHP
jgi:hypothetical protein